MINPDTISNFFSNIKNGYFSKKSKIRQLKTKPILQLLNIFIQEGWIQGYQIEDPQSPWLWIYLKAQPPFRQIQRISKPGRRVYIQTKDLFQKTQGIYLISTSQGIMTDLEAKQKNLGGEFIGRVL